jgi:hypothetical protein
MADEFQIWVRRIKAVEREYLAADFSVERSLQHVRQDPSLLTNTLKVRDLERAFEQLEATLHHPTFRRVRERDQSLLWKKLEASTQRDKEPVNQRGGAARNSGQPPDKRTYRSRVPKLASA